MPEILLGSKEIGEVRLCLTALREVVVYGDKHL